MSWNKKNLAEMIKAMAKNRETAFARFRGLVEEDKSYLLEPGETDPYDERRENELATQN